MSFVAALARRALACYSADARPFLVALCGWADTGKSTLAGSLCEAFRHQGLGADWISTDAFLIDRDTRNRLGLTGYDPASIDADEMQHAMAQLRRGGAYRYHPYVNRTGTRAPEAKTIEPQPIVVIEGIHALHPRLLPWLGYKVFIDAPADVLKDLRIRANIHKRGMPAAEAGLRVDGELQAFEQHTLPAKRHADCTVTVDARYGYTLAA